MDLNFLRSRRSGSDQPLGSRYKIVEQLGAGGFGQTFIAQDLHLPGHPLCVVKQLKPQVKDAKGLQVARRLFDTEAQVLYRLGSHPQIPQLLAHFEESNEFYLAQELIDGHSLEDEFETTPWEINRVIEFLKDVLDTLAFVHENRVIHRDLKPSNLIRRHSDNRVVLIDFGAVKQAGTQPAAGISHTISIGTQGYMPNEQLIGQPQLSSDVYAVGIMGIQALTGQQPKKLMPHRKTGELDWHIYAHHVNQQLMGILDTMVRYTVRDRYPSAKEALAALRSLPAQSYNPVTEYRAAPAVARPTELTVPVQSPQISTKTVGAAAPAVVQPPRTPSKLPAILVGFGILATGLLIGRACTPSESAPVAAPPPAAAPDTEVPEQPEEEIIAAPPMEAIAEIPPIEQPDEEIVEAPPPETVAEIPESPGAETEGTLTTAAAQTAVVEFYSHISNQSWDAARAQTDGALAREFDPGFFQQFQQVSIENLQLQNQTSDTIDFVGQNTYRYSDGSTQQEERTFTVQLVDGEARIVGSTFVRVIKSRS
ncbi:MAG: protein kinase [Cyanobacteria bacterium P01_H01_bin.21]